ncbi:7638_t:CDS:1, partial [Racocetra persica]
MQNKYQELLGVSYANIRKIEDEDEIENQMFQQQQIRTKPKPIIFLPKKPYHDLYKPNDNRPRTPPPKITI